MVGFKIALMTQYMSYMSVGHHHIKQTTQPKNLRNYLSYKTKKKVIDNKTQ